MRILYLLSIALLFGNFITAKYNPDEKQRLKFLYIKNFIKNIEWPQDSKRKEFKIGILGDRNIYNKISFSNIKPEHANGQNIAYYYFEDSDHLLQCQLVYISAKKSDELLKVIKFYQNQPVLIISESARACEKGSMINFIKDSSEKISFEYNKEAFNSAGLLYASNFMEQGILIHAIQ